MKLQDQIWNYIFRSCNVNSNENYSNGQKLGLEIEHFILDNNNCSVYYDYDNKCNSNGELIYGVKQVLKDLSPLYTKQIYSKNNTCNLIGLSRDDISITLEPGAQLEVSIKATNNLEKIEYIYNKFLIEINNILYKHNYHLAYIGYRPDALACEVPIIPKNRYYCMDAHFRNVGNMGLCMMKNTASVQVSIDFNSVEDFQKKYKLAAFISPLIYFLYDNSSVIKNKKINNNYISKNLDNISIQNIKSMVRYTIWNNTDDDRCGIFKELFDSNFNIKTYINKVLSIPLIHSPCKYANLISNIKINIENDAFYPNASVFDIVNKNVKLTDEEITHILSMVFYDVRIKNYLELRPADCMPIQYALSYSAFIKGLFYNKQSLDKALNIFENFTYDDYINTSIKLKNESWSACVYDMPIDELLNKLFALSLEGLCKTETKYLKPSINLITNKKSLKGILKTQNTYKNLCNFKSLYKPVSNTHINTLTQLNYYIKNKGCLNNKILRYNIHKNSKAIFEEKVVDTAYFPKVYDQLSILQFNDIVKTTYSIWNKLMNLYFSNKNFRALYKWDSFSAKLINFRPKYTSIVPISRIDIFYSVETGQFNICEFNTGGTAAQSEVSYLTEDTYKSEPFAALSKKLTSKGYKIKSWELYKKWVDCFIKIYNQWALNTKKTIAKSGDKNFNIAIVDFLENSQFLDFKLFKQAFNKLGFSCCICDFRDLKYDGSDLLTKDGIKINAVYKRATLNDIIPHKNNKGLNNFINAVFDHNVCPIDWFNTQIIHDKQVSYILQNQIIQNELSPSENTFIKQHLPYAARLSINNYQDIKFINNKNNYIVKPLNGRRSKDIFSGREFDDANWKKILKKCASVDNYIIQEYCQQYTSPNIEINVNNKKEFLNKQFELCIKDYANMEGIYCYDGNFAGIWLRQGDHTKTSTTYNVTTPTFYMDFK